MVVALVFALVIVRGLCVSYPTWGDVGEVGDKLDGKTLRYACYLELV